MMKEIGVVKDEICPLRIVLAVRYEEYTLLIESQ